MRGTIARQRTGISKLGGVGEKLMDKYEGDRIARQEREITKMRSNVEVSATIRDLNGTSAKSRFTRQGIPPEQMSIAHLCPHLATRNPGYLCVVVQ